MSCLTLSLPPWTAHACLIVAISGPLTHYSLWVRITVDDYVEQLFLFFLLFQPLLPILIKRLEGTPFVSAWTLSILLQATYLLTLALSITIYRLFLHPTRHIPGPFWARLSVFWKISAFISRDTQCYLVFEDLHKTYGDVVRVGPRHVSINNVEALSVVDGRGSTCSRAANADLMRDGNIMCLRGEAEHARRRVVWDQALGAKSCHHYLPRITHIVDLWTERIRKERGRAVSATDWVQMLAFDISGASGWGKSYDQIESGKIHSAIEIIHKDLKTMVYALQLAWLVNVAFTFPGMPDPSTPLKKHCERMLEERETEKEKTIDREIDVLSILEKSDAYTNPKDLLSDLRLLTLAASDTTYSAIVFCLYHLIHHPQLQDELRDEVRSALDDQGRPIWSTLSSLPLLDSIITETLRLNPPVPSGLLRELPPRESAMIAGHYIPAGTQLSCPTYSLHRDEGCFEDHSSWVPERWTSRPEMVRDRRAYVPFGLGNYMCAGKHFAVMEMKVFLAKVVMAFEVRFEEGDDGARLMREAKDCFTMSLPDQTMIFAPRQNG